MVPKTARVLGTVALGLALLATAARAQSSKSKFLNVGVGPSFSLTSVYDSNEGFNVRVGGTSPLNNESVWIRGEVAWDHFRHLNLFALEADAGYTFKTTGKVGSYLFGGPQYTEPDYGGQQGSWGANVGGGLTFPLASRIGYLEIRYVWVGTLFSDGFETIPVTLGIRF